MALALIIIGALLSLVGFAVMAASTGIASIQGGFLLICGSLIACAGYLGCGLRRLYDILKKLDR